MLKKIVAVLALSLTLSSCTGISKELSERLIVSDLGIDYKNGMYTLTALCLSTEGISNEQKDYNTEIISCEAKELYSAFLGLSSKTVKEIFWEQAAVAVIGKGTAEDVCFDTMKFLIYNESLRINMNVFLAENTAAELLKLPASGGGAITAEIEELLENKPDGYDFKVELYDIASGVFSSGVTGFIPIVSPIEEEVKGQEKEAEKGYRIAVKELAIIDKNKVVGRATGNALTGIMLLKNRAESVRFTFSKEGASFYANAYNPFVIISSAENENAVVVELFSCVKLDAADGKHDKKQLNIIVKEKLNNIVETAYEYCYFELGVDLFNFDYFSKSDDKEKTLKINLNTNVNLSF